MPAPLTAAVVRAAAASDSVVDSGEDLAASWGDMLWEAGGAVLTVLLVLGSITALVAWLTWAEQRDWADRDRAAADRAADRAADGAAAGPGRDR